MSAPLRRRVAGTTLVELMVALVVGMVLCLAVFATLGSFEGRKRTITAGNDLEQAAQIAMYKLDSAVRGAGAGLAQVAAGAYGCPLRAARSGTALVPPSGTVASRIGRRGTGVSVTLGLAPVLILPQATIAGASGKPSDALVVMGAAPEAGTPTPFTDLPSGQTLNLLNSVDLHAGDLVLVGDSQPGDNGVLRPCMVQQVAAGFAGGAASAVPLGGPYQAVSIGDASLGLYGSSGFALRLGRAAHAGPRFLMLAVGDNNVLYSYDLLSTGAQPPQAEAEGVFELHALYGVDTDGDGKVDDWVSPSSGAYAASALSSGTAEAAALLAQVKAVRLGLILRTSLPERDEVGQASITLFADLPEPLRHTRELSTGERHYRYRTLEETVPVRNNLLPARP